MKTEYMYVFVRKDLSVPQQIVQASHASASIGRYFHDQTNIVLCDAHDEQDLMNISSYLDLHDIRYVAFYEPDVESYTALATQPLVGDKRKHLKRFSLMK